MAFRFKQFTVEDDHSTMRIGTDAMIMGSWVDPGNAGTILDIGTGCGVLALMMAQKSKAMIHAIDIDRNSVDQSQKNFSNSPWTSRLTVFYRSFTGHAVLAGIKYDLIITNPPFFMNSLRSPDEKRNLARHGDSELTEDLFESVNQLLNNNGEFYIILPSQQSLSAMNVAENFDLYVIGRLNIKSKPGKAIHRVITRFGRTPPEEESCHELIIRNSDNSYSEEYLEMTRDYHVGLTIFVHNKIL
ncbi:MAG: methyltransferase [Bacteroidetes bacterium]|nr:methyltransferase [Bacteroidota bacterium]